MCTRSNTEVNSASSLYMTAQTRSHFHDIANILGITDALSQNEWVRMLQMDFYILTF